MQQVLEKAGSFFDGKARLADVALERNFGVDADSPLLEGGVSFLFVVGLIANFVLSLHLFFKGCRQGCQNWLHSWHYSAGQAECI